MLEKPQKACDFLKLIETLYVKEWKTNYCFLSNTVIDNLSVALKLARNFSYSETCYDYQKVLFCEKSELNDYDIKEFLYKHYNHICKSDTNHVKQGSYNPADITFLKSALLLECCLIDLYNSNYLQIDVDSLKRKLITVIEKASVIDLNQLLQQGSYAAMVNFVLKTIEIEMNINVNLNIITKNVTISKSGCFKNKSLNELPIVEKYNLNSLLDKIALRLNQEIK